MKVSADVVANAIIGSLAALIVALMGVPMWAVYSVLAIIFRFT